MTSYDLPAEDLSRHHQILPTRNTTKARPSFLSGSVSVGMAATTYEDIPRVPTTSIYATTGQQQLVKEERKVENNAKSTDTAKAKITW